MTRPKRACATSDPPCPNLTHQTYCETCRRRRRKRDTRPSAAQRGYDKAWFRTRHAFLKAHPNCEHCDGPATEVDHRDGKGPLGPLGHHWPNLRALCKPCHSSRTAQDQPGGWNAWSSTPASS